MTPCYNYCLKLSRRPALICFAPSPLICFKVLQWIPTQHLFLDRPSSFSGVCGRPLCYIQLTLVDHTTQPCSVGSDLCNLMSSVLLAKPAIVVVVVVANHGYRCLLLPTPTIDDHTPNYCWLCQMTSVRIDNCKTFMVIALPKHGCFSPQSPSQPPQLSERNASKHRDTDKNCFLWILNIQDQRTHAGGNLKHQYIKYII